MTRPAYYNEFDPYAAQWLRNLIAAGHLPEGEVDERSITEVRGLDLGRFGQCHFFAGIGGWPLALRMAGVPDDEPVWTGSCPCQPFSVAGKRRGTNDERHLWPEFHRLIAEFRPARVYGEQVASRDALAWLDGVRADLENEGYAVGAANLCAAGVAAPSIRQRTYWFADRDGEGGPRLESRGNPGSAGPWGWRGKEDLRAITDAPHVATDRWPQPIVRKMDDGIPARVGRLRAYGNAIVPQVAAAFVRATL